MTRLLRIGSAGLLIAAAGLAWPLNPAGAQDSALPATSRAPAVLRQAPPAKDETEAGQRLPDRITAPAPKPAPAPAEATLTETEPAQTGAAGPPLPQPAPRLKLIPPEPAVAPASAANAPASPNRSPIGKLIPPEATPDETTGRSRSPEPAEATAPVQHAPVGKLIPPEPGDPPASSPAPQPKDGPVPPQPDASPAGSTPLAPPRSDVPDDGGEPAGSQPMPPEEVSCRARLRALGVGFEERPRIEDPLGCVVGHPIAVTKLSPAIALQGEAVVTCELAEAAARFASGTIAPAASAAFGEELTGLAGISAYVCRPRNGTHTLSEHAFGNALDISRFVLSKGTQVDVAATADPKRAAFLAAVRSAACGPFRTVLGPGSDADHATHLHLDLAPRRNDATYCH